MTVELQLDFEGHEVPIESTRPARLSQAQREILRHLRIAGEIRSYEAGRVLHAIRPSGCSFSGAKADSWTSGRGGCCPYGASDGSGALKRMAERGLVHRTKRGLWQLPRGSP